MSKHRQKGGWACCVVQGGSTIRSSTICSPPCRGTTCGRCGRRCSSCASAMGCDTRPAAWPLAPAGSSNASLLSPPRSNVAHGSCDQGHVKLPLLKRLNSYLQAASAHCASACHSTLAASHARRMTSSFISMYGSSSALQIFVHYLKDIWRSCRYLSTTHKHQVGGLALAWGQASGHLL